MTSVLVVDDSQFMRTVIGNILADNGYEVEHASDGKQAVKAVEEHRPDIVTMDVEMPGMNGIEAVREIMSTNPTPILMLSAHTEHGADATLDALSEGAVDFLTKPSGEVSPDIASLSDRLVEKCEAVERADISSVATAQRAAVAGGGGSVAAERERTGQFVDHPTVVIGASTGGPKLVERIVRDLPLALDAKVLVVQHMPEEFTARLAARLDRFTPYEVREAGDGEAVDDGDVVIAKGGYHMAVTSNVAGRLRIALTEHPRRHGVRPSIDVTMETAAETVSDPLCGVTLTGMGRDGAAGIEAIKAAGGATIAQDEATSPVFGIPKQAIETGCVDEVLPADEIAPGICSAFSQEGQTYG